MCYTNIRTRKHVKHHTRQAREEHRELNPYKLKAGRPVETEEPQADQENGVHHGAAASVHHHTRQAREE